MQTHDTQPVLARPASNTGTEVLVKHSHAPSPLALRSSGGDSCSLNHDYTTKRNKLPFFRLAPRPEHLTEDSSSGRTTYHPLWRHFFVTRQECDGPAAGGKARPQQQGAPFFPHYRSHGRRPAWSLLPNKKHTTPSGIPLSRAKTGLAAAPKPKMGAPSGITAATAAATSLSLFLSLRQAYKQATSILVSGYPAQSQPAI